MRDIRSVPSVVLVVVALFWTAPVAAANGGSGPKPTQILNFDTRDVPSEVEQKLYRSLKKAVDASDAMKTVERKKMTIQEMSVTAGCQEVSVDCLTRLSGLVDARRLVYGSVKRSGEAYLFTFRMFDFDEKAFVRELEDETVEGDTSTVKRAVPAVVDAFFAGDVGKLEVEAPGAAGARVLFDGEERGQAPLSLDGLPLGQHVVTIQPDTGDKKTKMVILRKGQTTSVSFDYGGGGGTDADGDGPPILGYTATGIGVAGLATGVVSSFQNAAALERIEELKCRNVDRALCSPPGENLEAEDIAAEAREQRRRVKTTAILSTVGYSVGAVGLVVGGYFLYRHYVGSPFGLALELESVGVQPTPRGAKFGLSFSF